MINNSSFSAEVQYIVNHYTKASTSSNSVSLQLWQRNSSSCFDWGSILHLCESDHNLNPAYSEVARLYQTKVTLQQASSLSFNRYHKLRVLSWRFLLDNLASASGTSTTLFVVHITRNWVTILKNLRSQNHAILEPSYPKRSMKWSDTLTEANDSRSLPLNTHNNVRLTLRLPFEIALWSQAPTSGTSVVAFTFIWSPASLAQTLVTTLHLTIPSVLQWPPRLRDVINCLL